MKILSAGVTDKGLVRANNEDNLVVEERINLFVVADGAGGLAAGEVASQIATSVIKQHMERYALGEHVSFGPVSPGFSPDTNALSSCVRLANQVIYETAKKNPKNNNMATTCVALYVGKKQFSYCNVGDSRIYLFRNNDLRQITHDHSLVMEQVSQGLLTLEQAEQSEYRNVLTRALGVSEAVEVDSSELPAKSGDVLLLCSDGLTRMLPDGAIGEVLEAKLGTDGVTAACAELVKLANDAGGRDNVTVVLVKLADEGFDIAGIIRRILKIKQ